MNQHNSSPARGGARIARLALFASALLTAPAALAQPAAPTDPRKPVTALYIPLADHYAGIVAFEKYRDRMKHADFRIKRMPSWPMLRAEFTAGSAEMAFIISPMAMDMYASSPTFRWVSLLHRDGNALAINDLLNVKVKLPAQRADRRPGRQVAEALLAARTERGAPVECAVPSLLATHTVVLYKYLKDHGRTLSLGTTSGADVLAMPVAPPRSPAFLRRNNARGLPACFEQSLPWADMVETGNYGHVAWYSRDVLPWARGPGGCIALAPGRALAARAPAIREVVHHLHQAGQDIEAAREEGGAAMAAISAMIRKHIPEHSAAAITQSLRLDLDVINYRHLNVDEGGLKQVMELAVEGGILRKRIDVGRFASHDFGTKLTMARSGPARRRGPGVQAAKAAAAAASQAAGAGDDAGTPRRTPGQTWFWLLGAGLLLALVLAAALLKRRTGPAAAPAGAPATAPGRIRSSGRLANTLVLWLMLLALVPLIVVSAVGYQTTRSELIRHAEKFLATTADLRSRAVAAHMSELMRDLTLEAESPTSIALFSTLSRAHAASGLPLDKFVKTPAYERLVARGGGKLADFRRIFGYYDVLLVAPGGDVVFSVARESDLGSNLFSGALSDTQLARTCRRVLKDGAMRFSDFARYAPSAGRIAGFLVAPVLEAEGEALGLLVVQVNIDKVDQAMHSQAELGDSFETYLLGQDMRMRSNSPLEEAPTILGEPIKSGLTRSWRDHFALAKGEACDVGVSSYMGRRGRQVLGAHHHVDLGGVPFLVISEVEERDALASARSLLLIKSGLLLFTTLLVAILGFAIARKIVTPVLQLSAATRQVAAGNLQVEIDTSAHNEIGDLARDFRTMVGMFREVADRSQDVARGDFSVPFELRGDTDQLTPAINGMIGYLRQVVGQANLIAGGDYGVQLEPRGRQDELARSINRMTASLADAAEENRRANWIKTGQAEVLERMRGTQDLAALCRNVVSHLSKYIDAQLGLIYVAYDGMLKLSGSFAHRQRRHLASEFAPGEGLVGQAALEQVPIVLSDIPEEYIQISSGLGEIPPTSILVQPLVLDGEVHGCLEFGSLEPFDALQCELLEMVAENIAITIGAVRDQERVKGLLEETQRQSEELQSQQEALQVSNEELEEQTTRLKASEERLRAQQEELQVTNEELEEKTELLLRQKADVERARQDISRKADALAQASKYKSEFLANMSHELRTPLNSLLLLARNLADNKQGNLSAEQAESCDIIYQSGNDLLALINEILDLSKIEAGRMELRVGACPVDDLVTATHAAFEHMAEQRGLTLDVVAAAGAPESIQTDQQRVIQVIKNLVANAIKFTEQGGVTVTFGAARPGADLARSGLSPADALCVTVRDTGIGIPEDQQRTIFEAFQQADGGSARRFGGTGLGLSISRELTALLGGEIQLTSELGKGSTFELFLPIESPRASQAPPEPERGWQSRADLAASPGVAPVADDREALEPGEPTVLLIEDDERFAAIVSKQVRGHGSKALVAATGEEGVRLAEEHQPGGIILDLRLPGMDGWRVLDHLKTNPRTRHIPVHIISGDEPSSRAARSGAIGQLQKPLSPEDIAGAIAALESVAGQERRSVLVIEDDEATRRGIVSLIQEPGVEVVQAAETGEALERLRSKRFDCVILDLGLWDCDGEDLLAKLSKEEEVELPPVIVYTARDLTWDEDLQLRNYSDSIIIKGVRSDERLLDEVSLFLHRAVDTLPDGKRKMITDLHDSDAMLRDKIVLLVDDDMRALFAMSRLLSDRGMTVIKANNGQKALDLLDSEPGVDVVLMDIMMPVLDGYETMKRIRAQERLRKLPIIALTAKAMKGDREQIMAAGANDYLPKPVDQDRLVSMLRVWLYR